MALFEGAAANEAAIEFNLGALMALFEGVFQHVADFLRDGALVLQPIMLRL